MIRPLYLLWSQTASLLCVIVHYIYGSTILSVSMWCRKRKLFLRSFLPCIIILVSNSIWWYEKWKTKLLAYQTTTVLNFKRELRVLECSAHTPWIYWNVPCYYCYLGLKGLCGYTLLIWIDLTSDSASIPFSLITIHCICSTVKNHTVVQ